MRQKVRLRAQVARQHDAMVLPELKKFLNKLPLKDRIKCAWRILLGRF